MRLFFTVLRVLIAVAVVNAAARVGMAYWNFYAFKDYAQQTAIFGSRTSPDVLRNTVLAKAGSLQLPLGEEQIAVRKERNRTIIAASYVQPVEYFPNRTWPVTLSFEVEGFTVDGAAVDR